MNKISKLISEVITLKFDFLDQVRFGEVLSSATFDISLESGIDADPLAIIFGPDSISNSVVSQKIQEGMAGVTYIVTCKALGSLGTTYVQSKYLVILADPGSWAPSSQPLLQGTLPDGVVGAFYSGSLTISGGYAPYTPVGLIAGAPAWMGFAVVGNQLICAGTPDEATPTTYNFSPTILDSALNPATSPQSIDLIRVFITGNAPDANIGAAYSYTYTFGNGTPPYSFVIIAGASYTGTTLNPTTAELAGVPSAQGNFSWTVQVTDANGIKSSVVDTGQVLGLNWLAWITGSGPGDSGYIASLGGETWPSTLTTQTSLGLNPNQMRMVGVSQLGTQVVFVTTAATTSGGNETTRYIITTNKGASFTDSNPGLGGFTAGTYFIALAKDATTMYRVVPSGGFVGIWTTTNPLGTWTYKPLPAFEKATAVAVKGVRIMTITTGRDYVHWSDNGGTSWTKGTAGGFGGANIEPFGLAATSSFFIAAVPETGLERIRYSADGSGVWTNATVTMTSGDQPMFVCPGTSIIVVGCANATGKVYFSIDGGASYSLAANTLGGPVNYIATDGTLFVAGTTNGQLLTSRDGTNWTLRYTNPSAFPISAIIGIT